MSAYIARFLIALLAVAVFFALGAVGAGVISLLLLKLGPWKGMAAIGVLVAAISAAFSGDESA